MRMIHDASQLHAAMLESRALVPVARDVLGEVIHEVTGRSPDAERLEFVSLFWLMHLCDQFVADDGGVDSLDSAARSLAAKSRGDVRARLLSRVSGQGSEVQVVSSYLKVGIWREFAAALRSRGRLSWGRIETPASLRSTLDTAKREAMATRASPSSDVRSRLRHRIALSAPEILVEQHHEYARWAEMASPSRFRVVYTANAHQRAASFRYKMFAQRQAGSRLAIHQHGGGYGIDEQHLGEDHDITLGDVFFTWGWTRNDTNQKVRPLPIAFPTHRRNSVNNRYLLMSLPVTSHIYRLQPFLLPSHVESAVAETVAFAGQLTDGIDLCVRSSGSDAFPMSRLEGSRANISSDDLSEPGSLAASRHRLVIHNYLGTSWLETLAMKIPTVCFYDPVIYRPRAAARPFVEALAKVGVIHHSGIEAAKFVNGLNGDPRAWWQSVGVQEAREAFVARYANFSDNWLPAWIEEFERLLAE